jgi:hypothetical protein
MTETNDSLFYLGKRYDLHNHKVIQQTLLYEPADLTTHAVITGMTGSGKTGLGVCLLEEAALQRLPAIIIDPKGDLTNLLLHFPNLLPADFQPWVDPDEARRKGLSLQAFAEQTADLWKNGLQSWGLGSEQLLALQRNVDYAIYTPGSTAAIPVNILSSFEAPGLDWGVESEILRERISSIVTSLLALVGVDNVDPLRSREHILLANIIENAWQKGKSIDLVELILQVQNPPFDRLGAFAIDQLFPEKDRFDLALLLNNFLASPSFQTWITGQSLDVPAFLYGPGNKPRHSIFYLAHLSEKERMFFVSLLFAAVESWMRSQRGTSSLRTLLYFDEITGYLPPVANPPSRPIMLRMLKQARAFGVGLVLATQNPVDLDYKALSNAGTWMIGRLQTENDKERLLDGLISATNISDRSTYENLISGLDKRVFMLHNVHHPEPVLFSTRWALNYLAGPLTRAQLPALLQMAGISQPAEATAIQQAPAAAESRPAVSPAAGSIPTIQEDSLAYSSTRPTVNIAVQEYFLANDLGVKEASRSLQLTGSVQAQGIVYRPLLLAQATISYYVQRYRFEHTLRLTSLLFNGEDRIVRWEDFPFRNLQKQDFHQAPLPQSQFSPLPGWLLDERHIKDLERDFNEWAYRNAAIYLRANNTLDQYAGPGVTEEAFREMCIQSAQEQAAQETKKIESSYDAKIQKMLSKVTRQEQEVDQQQDELQSRRTEELGTHGELLLSLFTSRKRSVSKSLTKRRLTQQAKDDLEQEKQELEALEQQLEALKKDKEEELEAVKEKWESAVDDVSEVPVKPYKKDVFVEYFGIAWSPYYLISDGGRLQEVPAFSAKASR